MRLSTSSSRLHLLWSDALKDYYVQPAYGHGPLKQYGSARLCSSLCALCTAPHGHPLQNGKQADILKAFSPIQIHPTAAFTQFEIYSRNYRVQPSVTTLTNPHFSKVFFQDQPWLEIKEHWGVFPCMLILLELNIRVWDVTKSWSFALF